MRKKMWMVVIAATLGLLATSGATTQRGTLKTLNGQTFEGEIEESRDEYIIYRKGMESRIPRDQVASIRYSDSLQDTIRGDLARLSRTDVPGRLALAHSAFDARLYEFARDIAQQAFEIDPNSREAADMLLLIRRQLLLESKGPAPVPLPSTRETRPYLDADDINTVRQLELQPADEGRVRIRFINDVRNRFALLPHRDKRAFLDLRPFEQAMTIIREGRGDFRRDVQVVDDPVAIREFRQFQRQVVAGCGGPFCHGSKSPGGLGLFNAPESEPAMYTNFYLLSSYSRSANAEGDQMFAGAGIHYYALDRKKPEKSLLLQYGLPQSIADIPHPQVPGFRPMFLNRNESLYRRIGLWITDTLRPMDIDYSYVKYVSPAAHAATQPTSRPVNGTRPAALHASTRASAAQPTE